MHSVKQYEAVAEKTEELCGICGKPIDMALRAPHPLSRSIDHVVASSMGGSQGMDNLQIAHLVCNISKGPCRSPGYKQKGAISRGYRRRDYRTGGDRGRQGGSPQLTASLNALMLEFK